MRACERAIVRAYADREDWDALRHSCDQMTLDMLRERSIGDEDTQTRRRSEKMQELLHGRYHLQVTQGKADRNPKGEKARL